SVSVWNEGVHYVSTSVSASMLEAVLFCGGGVCLSITGHRGKAHDGCPLFDLSGVTLHIQCAVCVCVSVCVCVCVCVSVCVWVVRTAGNNRTIEDESPVGEQLEKLDSEWGWEAGRLVVK